MNLTTDHANGVAVVRIGESRLMYPLLSEFSTAVTQLIAAGERKVVVDLSSVGYVASATIGCRMVLYRRANAAGGSLKLAGVQKRVETMLTMTGAQNFIEVHPDEPSAVKSFGARDAHPPLDDWRAAATCCRGSSRSTRKSRRGRSVSRRSKTWRARSSTSSSR